MLVWVIPAMRELTRMLAFILQLVGLLGLLAFAFIGMNAIADKILEVTEDDEDHDRPGEEDSSLQPGLR